MLYDLAVVSLWYARRLELSFLVEYAYARGRGEDKVAMGPHDLISVRLSALISFGARCKTAVTTRCLNFIATERDETTCCVRTTAQ